MPDTEKMEVENFTSPGRTYRVDKAKFVAMRDALLSALPRRAPGITAAEAKARLLPRLPRNLFPGGEKAGWWQKAAQLDLEAKGIIKREEAKPLRFYRCH
jgi:hypothetical protein